MAKDYKIRAIIHWGFQGVHCNHTQRIAYVKVIYAYKVISSCIWTRLALISCVGSHKYKNSRRLNYLSATGLRTRSHEFNRVCQVEMGAHVLQGGGACPWRLSIRIMERPQFMWKEDKLVAGHQDEGESLRSMLNTVFVGFLNQVVRNGPREMCIDAASEDEVTWEESATGTGEGSQPSGDTREETQTKRPNTIRQRLKNRFPNQ